MCTPICPWASTLVHVQVGYPGMHIHCTRTPYLRAHLSGVHLLPHEDQDTPHAHAYCNMSMHNPCHLSLRLGFGSGLGLSTGGGYCTLRMLCYEEGVMSGDNLQVVLLPYLPFIFPLFILPYSSPVSVSLLFPILCCCWLVHATTSLGVLSHLVALDTVYV